MDVGKSPDKMPIGEPEPVAREKPPVAPPKEAPKFDPDATIHEQPLDPEFAEELERARQELRRENSEKITPEALPSQAPLPNRYVVKPPTVLEKIGDFASRASEQTKQASIMFWQVGGIHPWIVDGGLHWVVEPWAKISDDPNQWEPVGTDTEFYHREYKILKERGVKTIGEKELRAIGEKHQQEIGIPTLRPLPPAELQYLDHNRIKAAKSEGLRIRVDFDHQLESYS